MAAKKKAKKKAKHARVFVRSLPGATYVGSGPLPFVIKLSRTNTLAARVLKASYKKGVETAAAGDLEDVF
jgi:hypothetical protein